MKQRKIVFIMPLVAIVVSVVIFVLYYSLFLDVGASNTRFIKVVEVGKTITSDTTVVLGDSQVKEGIDCSILDCMNLGIDGIRPSQLLQMEITANRIVFGISPLMFNEELNYNADYALFLHSYDSNFLTDKERNITQMGSISRLRYMRKFVIPSLISTLMGTKDRSAGFKDVHIYEQRQTEEELLKKITPTLRTLPPSELQYRAMKALIEKVGKENIILVRMPLHPIFIQHFEGKDAYELYLSTLDVKIIDKESAFTANNFLDLTHLDAQGRKQLSLALKDLI